MRLRDCSSKNINASPEDYQRVYESFLNDPRRIWIMKQIQTIIESGIGTINSEVLTMFSEHQQTDIALEMLHKELEYIKKDYFELT